MGSIRLLKASAGSGKTYRLAYEYVRNTIREPYNYRHILAVTFTNKATEEMKRRILSEIDLLARGRGGYMDALAGDLGLDAPAIQRRARLARTRILHDYSHFAILTIDKFFQRIIRSFIKELSLDLNFNLELQTDSIISRATDSLIEDISVNTALRRWIADFVEEKIEEGKRWEVKSAITSLGAELFKEAYKQSPHPQGGMDGLREVISRASARSLTIKKELQKEALAAVKIISDNGLTLKDFANGSTGHASYFYKMARGEFAAPGKRAVAACEEGSTWCSRSSSSKELVEDVEPQLRRCLIRLCEGYNNNIRFINTTELLRENYRTFALLNDLSDKVRRICAQENVMPISETNEILHRLINGNDTPFIFEKSGNYFDYYMIDEFQDTSRMQWENFVPLVENALSKNEGSPVLIVGDVKQSIYRWRGGDWGILSEDIESGFGAVENETLNTNWRSSGKIVGFNNAVTSGIISLAGEYLNTMLGQALTDSHIGENCHRELTGKLTKAYRGHTQQPAAETDAGYVTIQTYSRNEQGVAVPPVIEKIEELQRRGYRAGDIAILVRENSEGDAIARMLLARKQENPHSPFVYDVVTQQALAISASGLCRFVISCMRLSLDPADGISLAVYNLWLGREMDSPAPPRESQVLEAIKYLPLAEGFEKIVLNFSLDSPANTAYLQALHQQVVGFSLSRIGDLKLFLKWWDEAGHKKSVNVQPGKDAINIITIHKAKGLEYKAVIIPYCDWSLTPKPGSLLWVNHTTGQQQGTKAEPESRKEESTDITQSVDIAAGKIAAGDGSHTQVNSPEEAEVDGSNSQTASPEEATGIMEGSFPIGYKEKMRVSDFSEDYFRETVLTFIDNINTFYVAATRPREELHIMFPEHNAAAKTRISGLISQVIGTGTLPGDCTYSDSQGSRLLYSYGRPGEVSPSESLPAPPAAGYRSYPVQGRLRLRLPYEKYAGQAGGISPRDYGILLHRCFEEAVTAGDLTAAIQAMKLNGTVSAAEAESLSRLLGQALQEDLIAGWFDGSWELVRNESEIIIPGGVSPKRPDRVMIKGDTACVVDYKFGMKMPSYHKAQVAGYMNLLRDMGYKHIEGYIWYVSLGRIEPVTPPGVL